MSYFYGWEHWVWFWVMNNVAIALRFLNGLRAFKRNTFYNSQINLPMMHSIGPIIVELIFKKSIIFNCFNVSIDRTVTYFANRPWWPSGLRRYLKFKERECLRTEVWIPTQDYHIDRSEVEILCHYSNSRALGDMRRLWYRTDKTL